MKVFAFHFCLLNHFKYKEEVVNFPFFILYSLNIFMQKFIKQNRSGFPLHQSVIKLVYDLTLTRHPRVNPNTNVKIEEGEENIPLGRILRNKKMKNKNEAESSHST